MAGPLDFTGKNIEDTYQRIVQVSGSGFCDGTGSAISIGGTQNLQEVTNQGSVTTTPITASIISASSYEGFGTDLQIASASNISNLYITEFRETGSSFSSTGQPEIGSVLVLDISGSGDGNESVLRRMDFQAFSKAFYASASLSTLLDISSSIAENAAEGQFVNGVFYQNGLAYDISQNGNVGVDDLLLLLAAFGGTVADPAAVSSPEINKAQLRGVNATHEGEGETQFMSGSFLITTSSLSGSLKPSINSLQPGTLRVDSHITSSGNIKSNGLIISGNINTTGTTTADNGYKLADGNGISLANNYSGVTFNDGGNLAIGFGGSWTMDVNKDNGVTLYELGNLGLYRDFRIEGNSDTHLFFVTGGDARIGIGTNTPNEKLTVEGNISASGELIGIIDGGTF